MDNEIELIGLMQRMWNRKWIFIVFLVLGLFTSSAYIYFSKDVFQTKIFFENNYSIEYVKGDNLKKIQHNFYNEKYFKEWKKISNNQTLDFNTLSSYNNENFMKEKKEQENFFDEENKKNNVINLTVFTNDKEKIQAYVDYLSFLQIKMKKDLIEDIKHYKDSIIDTIKKFNKNSNYILRDNSEILQRINFDIINIDEQDIIVFHRPTKPKLIKPHKAAIISLGVATSLILAFFIFFFKEDFSRK